jgi:t-SNARE complex subunit (syntaxin)
MKFKEQVVKAADALNERGDLLNEMQNKAKDLEQDSYSFKKGAIQVRKTECKKKAMYIIAIIVVIAIIIGIIVAIVN